MVRIGGRSEAKMTATLPGLGFGDFQTPIEIATEMHLDRLKNRGILTEDHTLIEAALMTLAHSMGRSAARGQSAGLALASKEMREWFLTLPTAPADDDEFTKLVRRMSGASDG
jgi:hypothetical protein